MSPSGKIINNPINHNFKITDTPGMLSNFQKVLFISSNKTKLMTKKKDVILISVFLTHKPGMDVLIGASKRMVNLTKTTFRWRCDEIVAQLFTKTLKKRSNIHFSNNTSHIYLFFVKSKNKYYDVMLAVCNIFNLVIKPKKSKSQLL